MNSLKLKKPKNCLKSPNINFILIFISFFCAIFLLSCTALKDISYIGSVNSSELDSCITTGTYYDTSKNIKSMENIESTMAVKSNLEFLLKKDAKLIFVLQGVDYQMLHQAEFDVAVLDPDDSKLKKRNVEDFQLENKKLIAYLSIGEAENYRNYWGKDWKTGSPDFLEDENPNWKGNYKVKYWSEEWQKIVYDMILSIINEGYNGVYLDVVDAYEYFETKGYENAKNQMVDFVISISSFSKKINPDFMVIPQNAEELINSEEYFKSIDGVGRESLWFIHDKLQDIKELDESLGYLDTIIKAGKFVFVINYCGKEENIEVFKELSKKHGFIAFVGQRELGARQNFAENMDW